MSVISWRLKQNILFHRKSKEEEPVRRRSLQEEHGGVWFREVKQFDWGCGFIRLRVEQLQEMLIFVAAEEWVKSGPSVLGDGGSAGLLFCVVVGDEPP